MTEPPPDHWSANRLPRLGVIRERLLEIFPHGLSGRSWAVAEHAAKSAYVFLYAFAIEGVTSNRVRPAMVTTMNDAQAAMVAVEQRLRWWDEARRPRGAAQTIPGRWYAENSREQIRDETFRVWKEYRALIEAALPTTSSRPRYSLSRDFADLFDPLLAGDTLESAIEDWQRRHLTPAARARMALVRQQANLTGGEVVTFPDGASRLLAVGPSTGLLKAAVEEFAPRFLRRPVVLVSPNPGYGSRTRMRASFSASGSLQTHGLCPTCSSSTWRRPVGNSPSFLSNVSPPPVR